jgi:hypothetical protein
MRCQSNKASFAGGTLHKPLHRKVQDQGDRLTCMIKRNSGLEIIYVESWTTSSYSSYKPKFCINVWRYMSTLLTTNPFHQRILIGNMPSIGSFNGATMLWFSMHSAIQSLLDCLLSATLLYFGLNVPISPWEMQNSHTGEYSVLSTNSYLR